MRPTIAIARSTVRAGLRRPLVPLAAALGCLALWAGVALDVLALGTGSRALVLGVGTAEAVGLLLGVLLAVRAVGEDESSGLGEALDGGGAGTVTRLTGRFLGVWVLALAAGIPVVLLSVALFQRVGEGPSPGGGWGPALVVEVGAATAWAVLLARLVPAGAATLLAAVVLVASRVPFGGPLAALLPRPVGLDPSRTDAAALAAQALAGAAALLAACAVPRPSRA